MAVIVERQAESALCKFSAKFGMVQGKNMLSLSLSYEKRKREITRIPFLSSIQTKALGI